jgi:hypothetical protein
MNASRAPRPAAIAVLATIVGAVAATVLGLLTFGAQATVKPDHVPLAVAVDADGPAAAQLRQGAEQVIARGGEEVSWRLVDVAQARELLDDKQVYGVLELAPAPGGRGVAPTVVLSGAVNPSGTQVAQQALTGAAQGLAQATGGGGPVTVETVHPATAAGRSAPLAGSALLWIGTLVGAVLITVLGARSARSPGAAARLVAALGSAVTVTAVVAGLFWLWDSSLPLDADVLGFMLLVAAAFALLQGAVLRLLGLPGMAILAPLYLIAPAVAGQVPELLHPAYRLLLWSWSPFRFSTEGLRSLLMLDGQNGTAPDVRTAIWVFAVMAVVGLVVLAWPGRRRPGPDADSASLSKPVPAGAAAA